MAHYFTTAEIYSDIRELAYGSSAAVDRILEEAALAAKNGHTRLYIRHPRPTADMAVMQRYTNVHEWLLKNLTDLGLTIHVMRRVMRHYEWDTIKDRSDVNPYFNPYNAYAIAIDWSECTPEQMANIMAHEIDPEKLVNPRLNYVPQTPKDVVLSEVKALSRRCHKVMYLKTDRLLPNRMIADIPITADLLKELFNAGFQTVIINGRRQRHVATTPEDIDRHFGPNTREAYISWSRDAVKFMYMNYFSKFYPD